MGRRTNPGKAASLERGGRMGYYFKQALQSRKQGPRPVLKESELEGSMVPKMPSLAGNEGGRDKE